MNSAFEQRKTVDCPHPHPHDPEDVPSVASEAGWCGCGDHDAVDRMMLAYLDNLNERATTRRDELGPHYGYRETPGLSPDAEMLIQYLADALDWTEHGGSVGGAWLTDEGQIAFTNLRARAMSLGEAS